ncbi:MAG: putative toxin-antitoxin system toxin component, PIN family [Burkholderiales bacterium]
MTRKRIVVDTNVLVSRLLLPNSLPARAVRHIVDHGQLLASGATLMELAEVLSRPKFDRYVDLEDRQEFFRQLSRVTDVVPITYVVRVCRDPKDDKFIELAVNGEAGLIVTGDQDLLVLGAYQGIAIMTPASYLNQST